MNDQTRLLGNNVIDILYKYEKRGVTLTPDEVTDLLNYLTALHDEITEIHLQYGNKMLEDAQMNVFGMLKTIMEE